MRKPLSLILGLAAFTAMGAQDPLIIPNRGWELIPTVKNGDHTGFYFHTANEEETETFTIYDDEFNLVSEFTVPSTPVTSTRYHIYPSGERSDDESSYSKDATCRIEFVQEKGGDSGSYEITKGIFGDDYTYIIPETEMVSFPETTFEDGTIYGYSETMCKGFKAMTISGKEITKISFPTGYYQSMIYSSSVEMQFVSTGDKKYILINATIPAENKEVTLVYSLDDNSRASQIAIVPGGKVSPRAPKKGDNVSVSIDDKFKTERCIVNVISSDGRNMIQQEIAPGQTELNFNTSNFPQGLYIVTVTAKGEKLETAKIIVR